MLKEGKTNSAFYPQLDSLRAIAVILVIIGHWFAKEHILNRYTDNGKLGVTLFFVLSGFLITGILLRSKNKIEKGASIKQAYKIFYIRRSLRIFPIYYLLILLLAVFNLFSIRASFWWHFFYCSNFYFWIKGGFAGSLSHLWSLAVEEQFYLLWPAVIFLVKKKYLPTVFLAGIATAVVFRWLNTTPQNEIGRILMPGSLDSFCIGGLLAFGRLFSTGWYNWYVQKRAWFIFLSFVALIFVHTQFFKSAGVYIQVSFYFLFISMAFGVLIDRVSDTVRTGPLNLILSNRILLFIGKISYGIYLFHNIIPFFYDIKFPLILQPFSLYLIEFFRFLLLVGLCVISWRILEYPILKVKKRFEFV